MLSNLFSMDVSVNARYRKQLACLITSALLNCISISLQCSGECKAMHLKKSRRTEMVNKSYFAQEIMFTMTVSLRIMVFELAWPFSNRDWL